MKATRKKLALIASMALACVLALSLGVSGIFASAAAGDSTAALGGRYYSDFDSKEATLAAGEDFNVELASEGMTLLKNDGALPLSTGEKVSVLGVAQDCMVETTGSITQSLKDAGFTVNPTLEEFYLNDKGSSNDFGAEPALTTAQKQSMRLFGDVGIIVIARGTGGESQNRELAIDEAETETYLGEDQGWEHEAHEADRATGEIVKHELQLTESEEELIKAAKQYCKKIVVLYSASYTFELGNLEDDPDIDAIAWIGRLGNGGIAAVGQMLCGDVNPSGKTVDEWTRDFTNDPTYANAVPVSYDTDYEQIALGLDYEEDIYLGYKYYETYWAEAAAGNASPKISGTAVSADEWYDYNVVYPFGYGLSYTDFEFELEKLYTDTGVTIADGGTLKSSDISSSAKGGEASVKTLYADVAVTNIGEVAGKETVQVYINAPYTQGGTEKAYYVLAGYTKTPEIKAGKTQTVTVAFNVQDFASYDAEDANNDNHTGYELDAGTYTVAVMESSAHTNVGADAYAETTFKIDSTAHLDLDDYSGGEIANLFSEKDEYGNDNDYYSMLIGDETSMDTRLSRADFDATAPTAPTSDQLVITQDIIDLAQKYDYLDADSFDDSGYPWYKTDGDIPADWTQEAGVLDEDGHYAILLDDMAGVPLTDSSWVTFMNQLTWEEIASIVNNGYHLTVAVPSIGKVETLDNNGPNYTYELTVWVGTPTVSATWNTELGERYGMMVGNTALWQGMTGWYGPGANMHRSQFAGRNPEYLSQDSIQGGYMCAAICLGATETGINVYVKHFAIYDTNGMTGTGTNSVSEQCMRENYLKIFQMSFQEGCAHATMTGFSRIGAIYAGQNYNLIERLAREEWGWTGFCITDMYAQMDHMSVDGLVRAFAGFPDGDYSADEVKGLSGTWDAAYNGGQGGVLLETGYSATQWYCARITAQYILFNEANSAGNNNGIAENTVSTTITVEQGQNVNLFLLPERYAGEEAGHTFDSLTVKSGSLPEGLEIVDGYLTGEPLEAGTFSVKADVAMDGWINLTLNISIEVPSIITFEDDFDMTTLAVGEKVDVYVQIDLTGVQYQTGYTMSISEGSLPDGLTIDEEGRIRGTTTTDGTYTYTIAVKAEDENTKVLWLPDSLLELAMRNFGLTEEEAYIAYGPGGRFDGLGEAYGAEWRNASQTYYLTVTTVVGNGGSSGDTGSGDTAGWTENVPYIGENGNWFVNGEDLGVAAQGPAGADGKDGVDGADGSGCGSVVATDMAWAAAIVIVALAAVLIVRKARKDRAGK